MSTSLVSPRIWALQYLDVRQDKFSLVCKLDWGMAGKLNGVGECVFFVVCGCNGNGCSNAARYVVMSCG